MIQGTNFVSWSEFEIRHHIQIWPQSRGVLRADFVPQAVNNLQNWTEIRNNFPHIETSESDK